MNTFGELKAQLKLSDTYENVEGLERLKTWCLHHVSSDRIVEGEPQAQYQHYIEFVRGYFDFFLKHKPSDLSQPVAEFQGLNSVQFAALNGYDHFLLNQVHEADPILNTPNAESDTPLHLSASLGLVHTVEALLKLKADPMIVNRYDTLPIHYALFLPDIQLRPLKAGVAKALLAYAPQTMNAKNGSGDSVCHLMILGDFNDLLENILLQSSPGAALLCNTNDHYPIHTAILNGKLTAAKLLLNLDKVVTLADSEGQIALHYIANYGASELFERCCQMTQKVVGHLDVRDSNKKTPLMLAVEKGRLDMVKAFKEKGTNMNLVDAEGHTLIDLADQSNQPEIKAWLLENTSLKPKPEHLHQQI